MRSLWMETARSEERKSLTGDIEVEAAVIGGGMAGILTAFYLQEKGISVVVLEAGRTGSGQTRGTTAKITSQHNLIYQKLLNGFGREQAQDYASLNQRAIREYRRLAEGLKIDCELEERPAFLYSKAEAEPLLREAEVARSLGIDAEFVNDTALPFLVKGALRFDGQAQFHPLKFLYAVAGRLRVYEHTPALEVEGNCIRTPNGTVRAKSVVFATHYPFLNQPGYYFMRMHQERSYVLALEDAAELDGMYLGIEKEGLSFRNSGKLLLLGGGGHRTGENSEGGRYAGLHSAAQKLYPGCREAGHWSAQDCMTLDGIPYIGQFAESTPDWYVATGFGKWGMTSSVVAAILLSSRIAGEDMPGAELFSPQRFTPSASVKNLFAEGGQAIKGLGRGLLAPPKGELEKLRPGHGGIVDYEGERVGVYKDEEGEVFLVSVRCPHLGCQLEWNPDEKSWDCPCHGSRFDYHGNLLNNPAQMDIRWEAPEE